MSRFYRTGNDLGLQGTMAWLEKWYGEPLDLEVREVSIACPASFDLPHYSEARVGKQSDLHVFLKYAARCWMEGKAIGTVSYERQLYTPRDDLPDEVWQRVHLPNGRTYEVNMAAPRIMDRDDISGVAPYGFLLEVDVLCEGERNVSIEVGATRPFNLLTPLLDGLVEQAIWIPFPDERSVMPSIVKGYAVTDPLSAG